MGEWPEPQLFLADRPQPREAVRLYDQKEHDQRTEDHRLQIGNEIDRKLEPGETRRIVEKNRQQHNKGGAEERAEDAAETAEPISEAKFPASWENTGNFVRLASECDYWLEINSRIQWFKTQFPTHRNREFNSALQGINSGHQGIFLPDQESGAGRDFTAT